jgi:methionine synthase II (cobalamin-independent)
LAEPWLGTLPSPFALACAAGGSASAVTLAANLLAPQLEAWADGGCGLVVLSEPFLPREPDRVGELLDALARLPRRVPVALQLAFGDAAPLLEPLADAPLDAVGVDFYATALDALPVDFPKVVLAGVVDAASSLLVEPPELLAFAHSLRARRPAGLVLTPNGDLEHVPETIAREKLRRLGAAAAALREAA